MTFRCAQDTLRQYHVASVIESLLKHNQILKERMLTKRLLEQVDI